MCTWLEVQEYEDIVLNAGDAAKALGVTIQQLPTLSGHALEHGECLCDVDLDKAAEQFGYDIEWYPDDGFDCRMTKKEAA